LKNESLKLNDKIKDLEEKLSDMTESKSILETLLHEAYETKEDEKQNIE